MPQYLLSLDQGTTSSRAVLFPPQGRSVRWRSMSLPSTFLKRAGLSMIWRRNLANDVKQRAQSWPNRALRPKTCWLWGITNQRETTLLWDRNTGELLHRAIVWQDRRTADYCQHLKAQPGIEAWVNERTGLLLDPYFSATKLVVGC